MTEKSSTKDLLPCGNCIVGAKTPDPEHYEVTYYADLPAMWQDVPDNEVLEGLFQMFNLSRPQDF